MANTQAFHDRLQQEISAAHAAVKAPLTPEEVASVVSQVIRSLGGDMSSVDLRFYSDLEELAHYIQQAKHDIAAIKPHDISTDYIPKATDELDAVVGATEDATNRIMDVCDELGVIAGGCTPEISTKISDCTTKIFEACNFQDITGQRITKVVATLMYIDNRIEAIVKAMGEQVQLVNPGAPPHSNLHEADSEKGLLNGPQLPQNAMGQDDIDKLLSGA